MRKVELELYYNDKEIDVSDFIESFSYADKTKTNQGDDMSVTLQDVAGLWRDAWLPELGAKFSAKIKASDWFAVGDSFIREAGGFEIDDLSSSGRPSMFTISAVSVGITNSIRRQQNTQAWENITAKDILQELVDRHDFELQFYSEYNPILERWEQKQESDITCIKKLCEYCGFMVKITDKYIIIFRCEEFDEKEAEITIKASDGVTSWSFNSNTSDVYSAVEVKYYDQETKELKEYLYVPDGLSGVRGGSKKKQAKPKSQTVQNLGDDTDWIIESVTVEQPSAEEDNEPEINDPEVGQVLKVNRRVSSIAEAEELAKSLLRNANMRQLKGTITSIGRPDIHSGQNIRIEGFGRWDSVVWNVEEHNHEYSRSGYSSTLEIRGIIGF
ncbi:MAG: contractile injection system protein, VgrG/Pvc8 family [Candidatus Cloacimonetes bacterium]|nr:contractile injection system protein, VgrG/Pvc8 family [Candidatus Cloacimonadota bacterium]